MKIRVLYFSLFLLLHTGLALKAQVAYSTTNFTHDLAPFKVSISFINMENIITPITAGIMLDGQISDKLFYDFQLRFGYLRNFTITKENLLTTQKESKGAVFESGIEWVFADRIKNGRVNVTISSSYDGVYLHETYFKADCESRRYSALSMGAFIYDRARYNNSDSASYIISDGEIILPPKDKFTHFNQNTQGIYAGYTHRKIRKAQVKSLDTRYRKFYSTKFYAQILLGHTTVQDIIYEEQTYSIDNTNPINLGYRIGWQWDQMGVVTGIEFGKMPGVYLDTPDSQSQRDKIMGNNPFINYLRFTFHFNIYNSDRNYHLK